VARLSTDWIGPNALGLCSFLPVHAQRKWLSMMLADVHPSGVWPIEVLPFPWPKAWIFGGTRTAGRHINIS
jgi:hypothetical protein